MSLLESARVQRQSGRLLVRQYTGGKLQEGEIHLRDGQAVYARLGSIAGQDAFDQLLSWGNVRFTFIPGDPRNASTTPAPALDAGGRGAFTHQTGEHGPIRAQAPPPASQAGSEAPVPGLERLTPHKRDTARDVMSLPLTRPQRYVYFMVDGRRTIADISRCTGKTIQEIDHILSELQAQGLVVI